MGRIVNLGKEETIKLPNGKGYRKIYDTTVRTSLTQILSVSGKGYLKSAFNVNSSDNTAFYSQIQIVIDGTVVLNINNTTQELSNSYAQGITDQVDYSVSNGSNAQLPLGGLYNLNAICLVGSFGRVGSVPIAFPSASEQSPDGAGGLFLIPELIRFNTGLSISVKKEDTAVVTVCEYYLDD